MKCLYDKSKLFFTLVWIVVYVNCFPIADKLSAAIEIRKIVTEPLGIVFVLLMVGFLLTPLFYKGKCLLFCVTIHGIFNVISVFNVSGTRTQSIVSSAVLCVLSLAYALWMWKKAEHMGEQSNEQ